MAVMPEAQRVTPALEAVHALLQQGMHEKALAQCQLLQSSEGENPYYWNLLGAIHMARESFHAALQANIEVLRLNADNPDFVKNHALILTRLGRFAEAEAMVRRTLQLNPLDAGAYHLFSTVRKHLERDPLLEQARAALRHPQRDKSQDHLIHFALGKILDDLGEYGEAHAAFEAGNRCRAGGYRAEESATWFKRIMAAYDRAQCAAAPSPEAASKDGPNPIFVVGMPRSGSSLLAQILSSHPQVANGGELPDIPRLARALPQRASLTAPFPEAVAQLGGEILAQGRSYYRQRLLQRLLQRTGKTAPWVVDKLPENFAYAGFIRQLFPGAVIVHIHRDPRDTLLSCYQQDFISGLDYSFDLDHLLDYYGLYRTMMAHWRAVLPQPLIEVEYEALVESPQVVVTPILEAAGLAWDESCLLHERNLGSGVNTASVWQARQKRYTSSIGRWRHYEPYMGEFFRRIEALERDSSTVR